MGEVNQSRQPDHELNLGVDGGEQIGKCDEGEERRQP